MSLPDTPLELTDDIVDYLHDDHKALVACSLTCRQFLPRARKHLFKTLSVTVRNYCGFKNLVISSPHIRPFIRTVKISDRGFPPVLRGQDGSELSLKGFVSTITKCPSVTRLDFDVRDTGFWEDSSLGDLCTVEELHLNCYMLASMTALVELICAFPHLKKLAVMDVFPCLKNSDATNPWSLAIEPKFPLASCPALEVLRVPTRTLLSDKVSIQLTKWLFSESLHTNIHTLNINVFNREDEAFLRDFLKALGPGLQHLYLGLECLNSEDDPAETPLTLEHSTGLRTLTFCPLRLRRNADHQRPLDTHRVPDRRFLSWVPVLLNQVKSPFLQRVHFRLQAGGAEPIDMRALDWARLGEILSEKRFVALQQVTVEIRVGTKVLGRAYPFSRMPGMKERGIAQYVSRFDHK